MKAILAIVLVALASSARAGLVRSSACALGGDALLPAEECNNYIVCSNGQPIELNCPEGLNFNIDEQACDWPENVDCENRFPTPPPPPPFVPDFEALPNGCPVDFDIHWLLPDHDSCNNFFYCNFGEKVLSSCPADLHFNVRKQVCDYPYRARCRS